MDTLNEQVRIVRRETAAYAKKSLTGQRSEFVVSDDGKRLLVLNYDRKKSGEPEIDVSLSVTLVNQLYVIDVDYNNKQLVDALVQHGIPRSQIILAYAGETVPETVETPVA